MSFSYSVSIKYSIWAAKILGLNKGVALTDKEKATLANVLHTLKIAEESEALAPE